MADLPFWLQQLTYQAPLLLVSVVGFVLGLVNLRRYPSAALMTVLGCGVLFATALGYMGGQSLLLERRRGGEMPPEQFARAMSLLGLVSSGLRAFGLALVVIAVFAGRGGSRQSPWEPDDET